MSQDRRQFFQSLIAGGATVVKRPRRCDIRHTDDNVIYHGPMLIPERVAAIVAEHPAIKRSNRTSHLVSRYAENSWTWLFRCQIPEHRKMVGEIVRTPAGAIRVHCWSTADPERYTRNDEPTTILAAKATRTQSAPIMPPLMAPEPEWQSDTLEYTA